MPISGTFLADFESFYAASQKAVVSLASFESGGAKVEKQLNRTADAFSGKKIIQDATLMARVFHDAGGAATFTTAELRRMGAVGAEAMEKLRKGGQPIPAQLMAMGRETRSFGVETGGAAGKIDKLNLNIGQADAMLRRFGVSLPPEVRGIADLGAGSVDAAGKLTVLGQAGLVAGAGLAGWKLGEKIGEMTGLTEAIASGTAALRGWGDATGQNAAYSAEVLGRASKTAKRGITDMTEAMAINAAEAERMIAGNIKAGASATKLAADDVAAAAIMVANREKLRKVEHDFIVAKLAEEEALRKASADTLAALTAEAANEEVLANGTASEIIKKQNHDVYLARKADLEATRTDTKANLDALAALEATANQRGLVNQETLHTGRLKDAQDLAEVELRTYTEMSQHADQYTRGALQAQLEKYRELAFAATASGRAAVDGQDAGAAAAKRHTAALDKQKQAEEAILKVIAENRRIRDTGGLYTIGADGNVQASGDTVTGAALEGKASPVSGSNRTNAEFLAREIARLQALIERYVAAPARSYANDPAGARQAEAIVQQHLDAIKQLEYLEKLLAALSGTGGGGSAAAGAGGPIATGGGRGRGGSAVSVTVHVNGIFDPSAKQVLSGAVGDGLMRAVSNGRLG